LDRSLKAPRNPQRFSCTIEVAAVQNNEGDAFGGKVVRIATISGQNLLSLAISTDIDRFLTTGLVQVAPTIHIGGRVGVIFEGEIQQTDHAATIPHDQLVADAVTPEMLEDEPEAATKLAEFRTRLLKSVEYVDQAIVSLPKP